MTLSFAGRPKYNDTLIDYQQHHIFKAPYQNVTVPRSEKINPDDIANELNLNQDHVQDSFNSIPWNVNDGKQLAAGPINVWNQRNKNGKSKGTSSNQPLFHPEGGWQISWDAKIPEEYYAQNRIPIRYTNNVETQREHYENPIISFPQTGKFMLIDKTITSVTPTAVYETKSQPNIDVKKLNAKGEYTALSGFDYFVEGVPILGPVTSLSEKNIVSMSNFDSSFHHAPVKPSNVILTDKTSASVSNFDSSFQHAPVKPSNVILTDKTSASVSNFDSSFQHAPVKPSNVILTDRPIGSLSGFYSSNDVEQVANIPVNLKDRPDTSHSFSRVNAEHEGEIEIQTKHLNDRHIFTSNTAPIKNQNSNEFFDETFHGVLNPSKNYYALDNTFDAMPTNLKPSQSFQSRNNSIRVQQEPIQTVPWY